MADNGTLSPKRRAFVRAILTERDTRSAAKAAGIAERTAYRWIQDPGIQAAILAAESDALQEVTRGLLRLSAAAVDTLEGAMTDSEASPAARIRAADIVLARLLQLREQGIFGELEARLLALEAAREARNEGDMT